MSKDARLHTVSGSPREVGFAIGRTMGGRLARNISTYIELGAGRGAALNREALRCGALP